MIRAHKIRLHPTAEQANAFMRAAGLARFTFNWGLEQWTNAYEAGQKPTVRAIKKAFHAARDEEFPWVAEMGKGIIDGAFWDLGTAVSRFHDGQADGKQIGTPRFKSKKHSKPSFTLAQDGFQVGDHWVDIPDLGRVNMAEKLRWTGEILSARISKRAEWWFLSITVRVPDAPRMHPAMGFDAVWNRLGTWGDGRWFENQEPLNNLFKRVQRLNRALSRKQKGSKNYKKAKRKLVRLYYRVAGTRKDMLHKLTTAAWGRWRGQKKSPAFPSGKRKGAVAEPASDASLTTLQEVQRLSGDSPSR